MKKLARSNDPLLSRDEFRAGVFARDGRVCVICGQPAQDAHHILERRLFEEGGYYLSNGASLCAAHHLEAEQTTLSVEIIRERAEIDRPALPEHLYPDERYDKWGNVYLANGQRTKGELFHDESVQKVLKLGGVLGEFTDLVKYPRTLHLTWSPGATEDDRILHDLSALKDQEVVVTEKMDGENTTMYREHFHSRSVDGASHPSQSWARAFHAKVRWQIPEGWRVCAENLYAKHSISYDDLPHFLLVFSVWNEKNRCLGWDETVEWSALLNLQTVPVLYRGLWNEKQIRHNDPHPSERKREGYVVRLAGEFPFRDFRRVVAKFVKEGHNQTGHGWRRQAIVPNRLAPAVSAWIN